MIRNCFGWAFVLFLTLGFPNGLLWAAGGQWNQGELETLSSAALDKNPRILAARQELIRIDAEREELRGFFDPQLLGSTGRRSDYLQGADTLFVLGGAEWALRPGMYVDVQVQKSFLSNLPGEHDYVGQNQITARVRVPLMRDHGFRLWKLEDRRAVVRHTAAEQHLLAVCQEVRREVELRYVTLLETRTAEKVALAATQRVERLLAQAEELAKLKAIPEYQIHPARFEVTLRREEETAARQTVEAAGSSLREILAGDEPTLSGASDSVESLVAWAGETPLTDTVTGDAVYPFRGSYGELRFALEAVDLERQKAKEGLRPDVALEAQGTWIGDRPDSPLWAGGTHLTERNVGGLVSVTYRRALGGRTERAQVRQALARMAVVEDDMLTLQLSIQTELQTAVSARRAASVRLKLVTDAVAAARKTLEAEEERFRLGEGRSRNVLDAQKDLTDAIRRQTAIAAECLRAHARYRFATGYQEVAAASAAREEKP